MASSASGRPVRRSPSSPTSVSMRSSTAARSPPASPSATASQILVYKDMGLVSQVFDESTLELAQGPCRDRPRPLLDDRLERLAQRPADVPADAERLDRPGPQRQPDQHRRARRAGATSCPAASSTSPRKTDEASTDTDLVTALLASLPRPARLEQAALEILPTISGRVLLRLHGPERAVRRPRPAGHPAAGARAPRARMGGRLRDRRARHRRRHVRPRDRARRADRDRRGRPARRSASPSPRRRAACSSSSTSPDPTP